MSSVALLTPAQTPHAQREPLRIVARGYAAPQGSKSVKRYVKGRAILGEASEKVAPWRQDVVTAAVQAIEDVPGFVPFDGPVHLVVEFYLPRPKGQPKTRRTIPTVAPDLDKQLRAVNDALTTAAVWRDDCQVVDITARKRYATFGDDIIGHAWEMPGQGAVITVIPLDEESTWGDRPLELSAAARHLGPILPPDLAAAAILTQEPVDPSAWAQAITVPAGATDAKARAAVEKFATILGKRAAAAFEGRDIGAPAALVIEDGAARLSSVPGKPLTPLQVAVLEAALAAGDVDAYVLLEPRS